MQRFIARENIKHYKLMLSETSDGTKKAMIRALLADEEAQLAKLEAELHVLHD